MDSSAELRFDGWTLDRATGELSRPGRSVRLQAQPQRVLEELLAHRGQLVSREQLITRLWPRGVVDFDTSLNTAVHKLRVALGDLGEQPRYIETLPRRGYRWLVTAAADSVRTDIEASDPYRPDDVAITVAEGGRSPPKWIYRLQPILLAALVAVALAALALAKLPRSDAPSTLEPPDLRAEEIQARARHFLARRQPGDVALARRYFTEALRLQPGDADAWAGLASTHWLDAVEGRSPASAALPRMRDAANRALALDPAQVEARLRLAIDRACNFGDVDGARAVLEEVLRDAPADAFALGIAAGHAAANGDVEAAVEYQRRAVEAEPLSIVLRQNLVAWLEMSGRYPEASAEIDRLSELRPAHPEDDESRVRLLLLQAEPESALTLSRSIAEPLRAAVYRAMALHALGRSAEADAGLREADAAAASKAERILLIEAYAYRGDADSAFTRLEAFLPAQSGRCGMPELRNSPYLRSLHGDARWRRWLDTTGAPNPAARAAGGAQSQPVGYFATAVKARRSGQRAGRSLGLDSRNRQDHRRDRRCVIAGSWACSAPPFSTWVRRNSRAPS